MANPFDVVETRLRRLFEEEGASIFPWHNPEHQLIHQLVKTVYTHTITNEYGHQVAPSAYTIYINPDCTAAWQTHYNGLQDLAIALQKIAEQSNIFLVGSPSLTLALDPELHTDDIRVEVSSFQEKADHTTAMLAPAPIATGPEFPPGACLITVDGLNFPLEQPVINIGRRNDNHLIIDDQRISRTHAQLRAVRGQFILMDLNSTGGTFVNGERINRLTLRPGDVISLSGVILIYHDETNQEP